MISFLTANTGSSIEELKGLPFHEFMDYKATIEHFKEREMAALTGDSKDGAT